MNNIPLHDVPFALAIGALALITVWSPRRRVWKTVAVALLVALLPLGYVAYLDLLSRPKPLHLETHSGATAEVISAVLKETEGHIYLWLDVDGTPRSYEIDWQRDLAAELQKRALCQAEAPVLTQGQVVEVGGVVDDGEVCDFGRARRNPVSAPPSGEATAREHRGNVEGVRHAPVPTRPDVEVRPVRPE